MSPAGIARVYLGLNDRARFFEWMRKACETRVPEMVRLRLDPAYDPVRSDPRFAELLRCLDHTTSPAHSGAQATSVSMLP